MHPLSLGQNWRSFKPPARPRRQQLRLFTGSELRTLDHIRRPLLNTIAPDKTCGATGAIFGGDSGTSFTTGPTWTGSTSANATYAIMALVFTANPGTVTSSGWSSRTTFNNGTTCYTVTLEIVGSGAANRSGTESPSWSNPVNVYGGVCVTYTGTATGSPHDGSDTTAFGSTTSPASGGFGPTTVAGDLIIGAIGQAGTGATVTTFSAPLPSGANIRVQVHQAGGPGNQGNIVAAIVDYLPGATGTFTPSVTSGSAETWAGISSGIKPPGGGGGGTGVQTVSARGRTVGCYGRAVAVA
jgi:hypothetical protein